MKWLKNLNHLINFWIWISHSADVTSSWPRVYTCSVMSSCDVIGACRSRVVLFWRPRTLLFLIKKNNVLIKWNKPHMYRYEAGLGGGVGVLQACFLCDEDLDGVDVLLDLFFWGGLLGLLSQNISHRMSRTRFSLQLHLKLLWSSCTARPLISVDVSLHSNKKQKSTSVVGLFECCCSQGCCMAANQKPAWEQMLLSLGNADSPHGYLPMKVSDDENSGSGGVWRQHERNDECRHRNAEAWKYCKMKRCRAAVEERLEFHTPPRLCVQRGEMLKDSPTFMHPPSNFLSLSAVYRLITVVCPVYLTAVFMLLTVCLLCDSLFCLYFVSVCHFCVLIIFLCVFRFIFSNLHICVFVFLSLSVQINFDKLIVCNISTKTHTKDQQSEGKQKY